MEKISGAEQITEKIENIAENIENTVEHCSRISSKLKTMAAAALTVVGCVVGFILLI